VGGPGDADDVSALLELSTPSPLIAHVVLPSISYGWSVGGDSMEGATSVGVRYGRGRALEAAARLLLHPRSWQITV
jgi:hypothetical protein